MPYRSHESDLSTSSRTSIRVTSFLVPPAAAFVLLYHALADAQITVLQPEALLIIGSVMALAVVGGLIAAFGAEWMRIGVLALTAVVWIDMAFPLPALLEPLTPDSRAATARDRTRVQDIHTIQQALEAHIEKFGRLPHPQEYGEGTGTPNFWSEWWDVSTEDANGNGLPFLDFLVEHEVLSSVPVDPQNEMPDDRSPTGGRQYVYFAVPAGYVYEGGQCQAHAGYSTYMIGVTDLELEQDRPPTGVTGSGCECLWRDAPNYFQEYFDYLVCGRFRP